jgi:DNA-binding beta-propeller fold protein YncE
MTGRPTTLILAGLLLLHSAVASAQGGTNYTIDMDWARLPEGMTWDGPTSWVEADGQGNVIVMVRTAPYFRVFTRDGNFVKAWGEDGLFRSAHSVTFDPRGFLWATDSTNHVVHKFSPDGALLQTLGSAGEAGDNASQTLFNEPNHVAVAPNGDLYVSDGYVNARIVHLAPDGEFIRVVGGLEGLDAGQLKVPHGVAVDSGGRILVNDSDNQRISVFDRDGKFVETWPWPSRGGIVITADDTVYVSDVNAGAVNVLRDGELLDTIKVEGRPHGLAVDSDGAIYVSDSLGRKLIKITRD